MTDVLSTTDDGRLRVRLVRDEHAENPRNDAETIAHVITIDTHLGQYGPVDQDGGPLAHIWRRLAWNQWKGVETFERYVAIMHGGVVLESSPERGPRSLWYVTGEEALALDAGLLTEGYVEAEMQEYEAWLAGDVWGFVVEETDQPDADEPEWAEVDSCHGFYGGPFARAQARDALRFYAGRSAGTTA
ncbi:hypothetical protein [Streptomyces sp. C]|uniref:hypothetical protein n=1 Tax=Streptomyces sp. C TaxID=253839 RepID=UPI0001B53C68|nr:hypothetical protein [Streptomyces sp. C]EFL15348.1 predicted protein [Streptomyces sp. C]